MHFFIILVNSKTKGLNILSVLVMSTYSSRSAGRSVQWPSMLMIVVCYTAWAAVTTVMASGSLVATMIILPFIITFHSSLQHEALHGHIFQSRFMRYAAVFSAIGIFIPYERFRDTHLEHHIDVNLTDPYDDPESNFIYPHQWNNHTFALRLFYNFNNTLMGRMLVGPAISMSKFYKGDIKAICSGNTRIMKAYAMHGLSILPILFWLEAFSPLTVESYLVACYFATGILKIRTFLEHRAHSDIQGRSVIVEDNGLLALLFLNNNFHALHHKKPHLPWYELPHNYRQHKGMILRHNDYYVYRNYGEVFRRFFFKRKDPVSHPLL